MFFQLTKKEMKKTQFCPYCDELLCVLPTGENEISKGWCSDCKLLINLKKEGVFQLHLIRIVHDFHNPMEDYEMLHENMVLFKKSSESSP